MNINDMTIGQAKEIAQFFSANQEASHPYKIGQCYLIRTVTCHWVGKLIAVYQNEVVLEKASWVADTGRFHECLRDSMEGLSNAEIEPVFKGNVILGRGSFIDVSEWHHKLPEQVK